MTVADPRTLLSRHGLRAKKSWGQNFLVAGGVHDAIVRATVGAPDDWVLEIGAGLGTLTARLADAAPGGRVIAVERDRDMIAVLHAELDGRPNVEIAEENALTLDYAAIAARAGRPLVIAGNLPYQIATPLMFAIVEARRHVARAVLMLQKEMVDRVLAPPGGRDYGALGVMIATWMNARRVVRAPASAFYPAPRVDSAVIALAPLPGGAARHPLVDEARYREVVHAAFGQRRKTLRNALRARYAAETVDRALGAAGLDGGRRGETLSLEEFARLANSMEEA